MHGTIEFLLHYFQDFLSCIYSLLMLMFIVRVENNLEKVLLRSDVDQAANSPLL